jgi:hypothetical protein
MCRRPTRSSHSALYYAGQAAAGRAALTVLLAEVTVTLAPSNVG